MKKVWISVSAICIAVTSAAIGMQAYAGSQPSEKERLLDKYTEYVNEEKLASYEIHQEEGYIYSMFSREDDSNVHLGVMRFSDEAADRKEVTASEGEAMTLIPLYTGNQTYIGFQLEDTGKEPGVLEFWSEEGQLLSEYSLYIEGIEESDTTAGVYEINSAVEISRVTLMDRDGKVLEEKELF